MVIFEKENKVGRIESSFQTGVEISGYREKGGGERELSYAIMVLFSWVWSASPLEKVDGVKTPYSK